MAAPPVAFYFRFNHGNTSGHVQTTSVYTCVTGHKLVGDMLCDDIDDMQSLSRAHLRLDSSSRNNTFVRSTGSAELQYNVNDAIRLPVTVKLLLSAPPICVSACTRRYM